MVEVEEGFGSKVGPRYLVSSVRKLCANFKKNKFQRIILGIGSKNVTDIIDDGASELSEQVIIG